MACLLFPHRRFIHFEPRKISQPAFDICFSELACHVGKELDQSHYDNTGNSLLCSPAVIFRNPVTPSDIGSWVFDLILRVQESPSFLFLPFTLAAPLMIRKIIVVRPLISTCDTAAPPTFSTGCLVTFTIWTCRSWKGKLVLDHVAPMACCSLRCPTLLVS
jgi:hypothetical protein